VIRAAAQRVARAAVAATLLVLCGRPAVAEIVGPCWQGTTWFAENPYQDWIDYCWLAPHDRYTPGERGCWVYPAQVCSVQVWIPCPCVLDGICPPTCRSLEWREKYTPLVPIEFPCPEGRKPPPCRSTFTRRIVR
jgi:hypothetical protein